MTSITSFAILFACVLAVSSAAFTKENIVGTWVGSCKQQVASHPNETLVCLPNNAVINTNYTITYTSDKVSFKVYETSITVNGVTYTLAEESQSDNPWTPSSQSGFIQTTYASNVDACYFVNVDGDTMTEFGEYNVADYSPLEQCPTVTQSISCGTTFTYECTMTRQGETSGAVNFLPQIGAVFVTVFLSLM